MSRLPTVFLAGFQKCATTSLFESLVAHPDIAGPCRSTGIGSDTMPKEVHFFNLRFDLGIPWYQGLYDDSDAVHLLDGSPIYLCEVESMRRLAETIADPLFVVSMRDPVARACSAWNHWQQLPTEERWRIPRREGTLRDNIEAELEWLDLRNPGDGFVGTGLYATHLRHAFEFFPRERFHFTFLEWLEDGFQSEIQRILRFLNLRPRAMPVLHSHARKRLVEGPDPALMDRLRSFYREDGFRLRDLLGLDPPWAL